MNNLDNKINNNVFESIKHTDEHGNEFWYARELQIVLEYKEWRKFNGVINKAKKAASMCLSKVVDHFVGADKMVVTGDSIRKINDYKLSRYACYLIAQNADPRKEVVALAQTYFAIQTRRQELNDERFKNMSEDEKRLEQRYLTKKANYSLNNVAASAGVKNFGEFHNYGYRGLYGGETADDIFKRKGLRYREDILDNMSSTELAANYFRITQTEDKIKNENIIGETNADLAHFEVGNNIRNTIIKNGGTLPEKIPTPNKSLKEIEKEKIIESNDK